MHECHRVRGAESPRERVRERVGGEIETETERGRDRIEAYLY